MIEEVYKSDPATVLGCEYNAYYLVVNTFLGLTWQGEK